MFPDLPYSLFSGFTISDQSNYNLADEVRKATVFALANGYMSSRGSPESASLDAPGVVGHHINGLYDMPGEDILEREVINLPAWTPIALSVDGHRLVLDGDPPAKYTRTLDMRHGLLQQEMRWRTPGGVQVTLHSERWVSMARPHLAAVRWELSADARCQIELVSAVDARVTNRFAPNHFASVQVGARGAGGWVAVNTIEQGHQVIVMAAHTLDGGADVTTRSTAHPTHHDTAWAFWLDAHQPVTLVKWVAVYDSRFTPGDLLALCEQELAQAQAAGYAAVRQAHAQRWDELWAEADVQIDGDEQAQVALRFCLFHLLANSPHSDRVSIAARGLQGQDYWGSIFWDYEVYVLPFFITTQPEAARRSLVYRYHTLDGARRKARSLGFQGAYYAWQSQETGDETCALYVFTDPRTGQKFRSYFADEQIHISADIVFAIWQYVQATGDRAFLAEYGLAVLCEVARFFASRVVHNLAQDRYELHTVLGPDEYHERVNNNAYTNALVRYSFQVALDALAQTRAGAPEAVERLYAQLGLSDDEVMGWQQIAARLMVPAPDPASGLIEQFDGYFDLEDVHPAVARARLAHPDLHPGGPRGPYQGTQSIKQADVALLLYLLRAAYDPAIKRANWEYYEPRTAHDSSLSPMAYALLAADVGKLDWAYRYFLHTALLDLLGTGPHWNLGVHTAAMGGAWLAVVHGFCQLDLNDDGVHLLAWPRLPEGWSRVAFSLRWHGHRVAFATDGHTTTLEAATGPVPVIYPGGQAVLRPGEPVRLAHTS